MGMTIEELEAEVMRLKKLEAGWSRTKDYIEIWQLNSTYSHSLFMFKMEELVDLFAQKTPGVELEVVDSGVYEGIEGVRKVFVGMGSGLKGTPGHIEWHMHVNPILRINKKGTKAKGIWNSPGLICVGGEGGKREAVWEYGRYDIEYVKEDGQWKFLKFRYRTVFNCSYYKSWAEQPQHYGIASGTMTPEMIDLFTPDRPTTYHRPYTPSRLNRFEEPAIPEPYDD